MATVLHFADSRAGGCGATIKLPSGDPCFLSIARSSVLVKKSRFGFMGSILYRESNVYKSARTAMALAYLFPEDKTPAGITNPILRSFFNALLHCDSPAEISILLNEAVQRAERKAGCALEEIPREDFPSWATPNGVQPTPEVATSTVAPPEVSIERLMLALDKVAEEFLSAVGAIPSVKAANEYMRLPGFLEQPAMTAAFMVVALVAAKKYETFFGSQFYANFRDMASKRMITVLADTYVRDLGENLARRRAYSIVDQELSRCHHAVSEAIHNFIDDEPYPLNSVFTVINNRLQLAHKQDAAGQFSPADIEQNYRPIFTKLAEVAGSLV
jgi:hypothetical protein